jgi:hypothetical protein
VVSVGASMTVAVANGPGNPDDWVSIVVAGAGSSSPLSWMYLNGGLTPPTIGVTSATMSFAAPSNPGSYQVLFLAGSNNAVLASAAFTTQSAAPPPSPPPPSPPPPSHRHQLL